MVNLPVEITTLGQKLREQTDELNAVIADAERAIEARKCGVRASVVLSTDEALAFGKFDRQWRLIYVQSGTEVPLVNASRAVRLRAIEFLPNLIEALRDALDTEITRVENAIATVQQFVIALEGRDR